MEIERGSTCGRTGWATPHAQWLNRRGVAGLGA